LRERAVHDILKTFALVTIAAFIAGCVSSRPAPVTERSPPAGEPATPAPVVTATAPTPKPAVAPGPRPDIYTVKPGDTLYSIALEHGLDYRELAVWNGIDNPSALRVGSELRLTGPAETVTTAPLRTPGGTVLAKPLSTPTPVPIAPAAPSSATIVSEPKGVRLPYSEQALAQLSKPAAAAPRAEAPRADTAPDTARGPDDLDWAWPVRGKVIATFNDASNKGIAIAGRMGQPVLASAPGRVIFSGSGIRGFGKLVVIKHNNTYLSVYAHNNQLLVKEGQNVSKGQKIAEMGSTDADQVKLHFEIRRFGKPIDPLKLLPSG
jgi:lipoprotein NlpD